MNKSHHTEYKETFTYQIKFKQTTAQFTTSNPIRVDLVNNVETFCVTSGKM